MHNCQFLVQNSDNPTVYVHSYGNTGVFTTLCIKFQAWLMLHIRLVF